MVFKVHHQPSGGKEWIARIVGRHPKYQFNRDFLTPIERDWSRSGKTGWTFYELVEGVYEVNEPWRGRYFLAVENGEAKKISAEEVLKRIGKEVA